MTMRTIKLLVSLAVWMAASACLVGDVERCESDDDCPNGNYCVLSFKLCLPQSDGGLLDVPDPDGPRDVEADGHRDVLADRGLDGPLDKGADWGADVSGEVDGPLDGPADRVEPDRADGSADGPDSFADTEGDTCDRPIELTTTWVEASTDRMTDDDQGSCGGSDGRDMVFRLELMERSRVHLDTLGSAFDTVLYVREGDCLPASEIGCNDDDAPSLQSIVDLERLEAGTYYIFVDGHGEDDHGELNLTVIVTPTGECDPGDTRECPLQQGICDKSLQRCEASGLWADCDYGPSYEAMETICDGLDNDCDGEADQNLTPPLCPLQQGVCQGAIHPRCLGASGWEPCSAEDYGSGYEEGAEASCDGLDNDCDGHVDEGDSLAPPLCLLQRGVCQGSVAGACNGSEGWGACTEQEYGQLYEAFESTCSDGYDNDCDDTGDCDDPDCNGQTCAVHGQVCRSRACTCPSGLDVEAQCRDGRDNDCDNLVDCLDIDCEGLSCGEEGRECREGECACPGGEASEISCGDGEDNDCDGFVDCQDLDCQCANIEVCHDGTDNDADGLVDCQDDDCLGLACGSHGLTCEVSGCACPGGEANETSCGDGEDNDCDGLVDCEDPDCGGLSCGDYGLACLGGDCFCTRGEAFEITCFDGQDSDCDGLVDCEDPDCHGFRCGRNGRTCQGEACICSGGDSESLCDDHQDNDCDGFADCQDTECTGDDFCLGVENCHDGRDNNGNGQTDCQDSGCIGLACGEYGQVCDQGECECPGGEAEGACDDGEDNDCDGLMDCEDPDCSGEGACIIIYVDAGVPDVPGDLGGDAGVEDVAVDQGVDLAPDGVGDVGGDIAGADISEPTLDGPQPDGPMDLPQDLHPEHPEAGDLGEDIAEDTLPDLGPDGPSFETCHDGIDNDGDGLTDCEDLDCEGRICGTEGQTCQEGACRPMPSALSWAERAGGTASDQGWSLAVLPDGAAWVTGWFQGSATFGEGEDHEVTLQTSGDIDIFLARYNGDGTLAWARQAGGTSNDAGLSVALLEDGSALVTGYFQGEATFGLGETNQTSLTAQGPDMFLAKYNPNGDLVWARGAGGEGYNAGHGVVALGDGSALVSGVFEGTMTLGAAVLPSAGSYDIFLAHYDAAGDLIWARGAGGAASDKSWRLAALDDGSALMTGWFSGTMILGEGEDNEAELISAGGSDIFLARYNPQGALAWAIRAGGGGDDFGYGVAPSPDGDILVAGSFSDTVAFGLGHEESLISQGGEDAFLARYSAEGTLRWARGAGGASTDAILDVAAHIDGSAVVSGTFGGDVAFEGQGTLTAAGLSDLFLARYDLMGTLSWIRQAGGPGSEKGGDLALLPDGSALMTGTFSETVAFGEGSAAELPSAGDHDIFIVRY